MYVKMVPFYENSDDYFLNNINIIILYILFYVTCSIVTQPSTQHILCKNQSCCIIIRFCPSFYMHVHTQLKLCREIKIQNLPTQACRTNRKSFQSRIGRTSWRIKENINIKSMLDISYTDHMKNNRAHIRSTIYR